MKSPRTETEPLLFAVGPEARNLAERLRGCGLAVRPGDDLEEVLADAPDLVLVDPTGWEGPCRRALQAFDARPFPPPAILFAGARDATVHAAGPAFAAVPADAPPGRTAGTVSRALRARREFARAWPAPLGRLPPADVERAAALLEEATGIEMRRDRAAAFAQALRTRMVARLTPTVRDYVTRLERRGTGEYEALAALLSVGETYFWRYAGQFQALQGLLLPVLAAGGETLRIWCAGCASGEEAYSVAMAVREARGDRAPVEVVGTDIHQVSLARAREGVYRERALRNLPAALRRRHLEPAPGGERVRASLREAVRFEFLNLGDGKLGEWVARKGRFHAVFCRNTLIYLSRRASSRALEAFQAALVEGGGLFLGASEVLYPHRAGLEPVRGMGAFFYRKGAQEPPAPPPVRASGPGDGPGAEPVAPLYEEGLARLDQEDFEGAEEIFRHLREVRPEDARGHTGTALLLANAGREAEAEAHLERALGGEPRLAEARYLAGLLAERAGDEPLALRRYGEALAMDERFFMAHVNRAWILRRLGREERFLEEMRRALAILRDRPRVSPWLTGGVGWEALLALVAEAVDRAGGGS